MPRSQHDALAAPSILRRALLGATLLAALAAAAACGCAPEAPEGTARPLRATYPSGVVRSEGTEVFRAGKWRKHGEFVLYDEAGDETHRGTYADGLESGEWHERYEDGGTGRGHYVAGKRHGEWQYMHSNGRLHQRGMYEAGERVGAWREWSPAGEPRPDRVYGATGKR